MQIQNPSRFQASHVHILFIKGTIHGGRWRAKDYYSSSGNRRRKERETDDNGVVQNKLSVDMMHRGDGVSRGLKRPYAGQSVI